MARKPTGPSPRNNVINFRLDDAEHTAFEVMYKESGCRSPSEFVREYILKNKAVAQPTEYVDTAAILRGMIRINARLARIEDKMGLNGRNTNATNQESPEMLLPH